MTHFLISSDGATQQCNIAFLINSSTKTMTLTIQMHGRMRKKHHCEQKSFPPQPLIGHSIALTNCITIIVIYGYSIIIYLESYLTIVDFFLCDFVVCLKSCQQTRNTDKSRMEFNAPSTILWFILLGITEKFHLGHVL